MISRRKFILKSAIAIGSTALNLKFPAIAKSETKKENILTAVGDVCLGFDGHHIEPILNNMEEKEAFEYPFLNVKRYFEGIRFCNLEGTLTNFSKRIPKGFNFKADPKYVNCLKYFDVVTLANNHTMDFCREGLEETISTLDKSNIKHFGAGINLNEARKEAYIEDDLKFCFLGYSLIGPEAVFAKEQKEGTAGSYKPDDILNFIEEDFARVKYNSDILVVSFHWGIEVSHYPNNVQKMLARYSIDIGADVVLGHHPHVLQGIEEYRKGLIFYSLGNFMFSGNRNPSDKDSIIAKIRLSKNGILDYKVMPVKITSIEKPYQPYVLEGREKEKALNKLKMYSKIWD